MTIKKFESVKDYPESGDFINRVVEVSFGYDTSKTYTGEVVRDDKTEPHLLIIKLYNGMYVLSTECQYRVIK